MAIVLFILGRPGSGKSTAARHIVDQVRLHYNDWSTVRINDYDILYEMSRVDKRFSSTAYDGYDGFDVLDHSAFDDALCRLKNRIAKEIKSNAKRKLIIIEFARDDYSKTLKRFFPELLRNAYFLFIDTSIPICKQRIHERVSKPLAERIAEDDRFVSPFIFETYYRRDNQRYFSSVAIQLEKESHVSESHVGVIEDNNLTLVDFKDQVESLVGRILQMETKVQPKLIRQIVRSQLYKQSHNKTRVSLRSLLLNYLLF